MATEYPPLGKSYVISYSNGDKDFPIIAIKKDPRVDNYKRPDNLSPHPDSTRYPNHVFTGTQPTNTDERVIWIYEILPTPKLVGNSTNNEGQLVTVTTQRKSAKDYTAPQPSATRTVEVSKEDVVSVTERIVDAPEVFEGKALSLEKPDVTPQKWRASIPSTAIERTVEGDVEDPIELAGNEISKSEQQITQFTKRVRTEERDPAAEGTLTGEVFTGELGGGTAVVTEKYGANPQINPDYGTVEAAKEALGDGRFVTREVVLSDPPELTGQNYDEQLDIVFPFTQKFVDAENITLGEAQTEISPRDIHHSLKRTISISEFKQAALAQSWTIGDTVNISLPDTLTSVTLIRTSTSATGESEGVGSTGEGPDWDASAEGSRASSISVIPKIVNGYSGLVPANRYIFFLEKENAGSSAILAKLNELGANASYWPVIRPEPVSISITGGSVTRRKSKFLRVSTVGSVGANGVGKAGGSDDFSIGLQTSTLTIPPTLHEAFNFTYGEPISRIIEVTDPLMPLGYEALSAYGEKVSAPVTLSAPVGADPESVEATSPPKFPSGNYIVSIDSESFKYGLVRVVVLVAQISEEYT